MAERTKKANRTGTAPPATGSPDRAKARRPPTVTFKDVWTAELDFIADRRRGKQLAYPVAPAASQTGPQPPQDLCGLALSGGGIRSAAFSLGVTQYLNQAGLLDRVDYLSTVSGGGFTGAALASQLHAAPAFPFQSAAGDTESVVAHIRSRASYLAPQGITSPDGREMLATFLFGLLVNVVQFVSVSGLIVLLFLGLAGFWTGEMLWTTGAALAGFCLLLMGNWLRRLARDLVRWWTDRRTRGEGHHCSQDNHEEEEAVDRRGQRHRLVLMNYLLGLFLAVWPAHLLADWLFQHSVSQSWPLLLGLVSTLNVPLLAAALGWLMRQPTLTRELPFVAVQGLAIVVLAALVGFSLAAFGWMSSAVYHARTATYVIGAGSWTLMFDGDRLLWLGQWMDRSVKYQAAYCAVVYLGGLYMLGLLAVALVRGSIATGVVSMHDFFRDRINEAFIVRRRGARTSRARRGWLRRTLRAAWATDSEDPPFVADYDLLLRQLGRPDGRAPAWPYPVINTTMNYSRESEEKHALRRAGRFVLTPDFVGSEETDYERTADWQATPGHPGSLSLATATTISAAAIAPRMGFYTAGFLPFLIGFLNLRLGKLLPNPGRHRQGRRRAIWLSQPRWTLSRLTARAPKCFLSDGGHSENLGLVALLERRCRFIIAVDAEADRRFNFPGLGAAIRLARVDLGVKIDIDTADLVPAEDGFSRSPCAVGLVTFPADPRLGRPAESGILLYLKASISGAETPDLQHYKRRQPAFPHETTADQFFNEEQFEAYRQLGYSSAKRMFERYAHLAETALPRDMDLGAFFEDLAKVWRPPPRVAPDAFQHATEQFVALEETLLSHGPALGAYTREIFPESSAAREPEILHIVLMQIQLMEQVFFTSRLDVYEDHPENAGWMQLFRRYARSHTFQEIWRTAGDVYSLEFQIFCQRRLALPPPAKSKLRLLTLAAPPPLDAEPTLAWHYAQHDEHTRYQLTITNSASGARHAFSDLAEAHHKLSAGELGEGGELLLELSVKDARGGRAALSERLEIYRDSFARVRSRRRLVVAVHEDDSPGAFCYRDAGSWAGSDVRLAKKLANRLGPALDTEGSSGEPIRCEFVPLPWPAILDAPARGGVDCAIASISCDGDDDRGRRHGLIFSRPYVTTRLSLVSSRDGGGPHLLARGVLGVHQGTTAEEFVFQRHARKGSDVIIAATNEELFHLLANGRVDAIVYDEARARNEIRSRKELSGESRWRLDPAAGNDEVEPYCIAFAMLNDRLMIEVNKILDALEREGWLDEENALQLSRPPKQPIPPDPTAAPLPPMKTGAE